nr:hypothetical protein [uncultured Desulfuromonas sp.]
MDFKCFFSEPFAKFSSAAKILLAIIALSLTACSSGSLSSKFNPKTCLEESPRHPAGLQILQGPRTPQSIALDMHPIYCNGQVLMKLMNEAGEKVSAGTVTFRVRVEYTGEVYDVRVITSDIQSEEFLRRVRAMILQADFTPWQRHDEDTEFIYPMTFSHWWDAK